MSQIAGQFITTEIISDGLLKTTILYNGTTKLWTGVEKREAQQFWTS
jgi:hypothetical protein